MDREVILRAGCEGGSVALLRESSEGKTQRFVMIVNELAAYDMLSEEDQDAIGPYVPEIAYANSFDEGIALLDQFKWFRFFPVEIHPEFIDAILLEVERRGGAEQVAEWRWRKNG